MTVNMKDLYSSPGNETQESKYLLEFPIKNRLTCLLGLFLLSVWLFFRSASI